MIDGIGRMQPLVAAAADAAPKAPPGPVGATAGTGGTPPGVLQPGADSSLSRIAAELAASPPVDSGKVERLRMAIADGSYKPDPMAIAGAMLALETVPAAK